MEKKRDKKKKRLNGLTRRIHEKKLPQRVLAYRRHFDVTHLHDALMNISDVGLKSLDPPDASTNIFMIHE